VKFALDVDGRFVVEDREFGFDLSIDGKVVHHCGTLNDALRYVGDDLREGSTADGLMEAFEALKDIEATIKSAGRVVDAVTTARAIKAGGAPHVLAGCSEAEFLVHPNRTMFTLMGEAIQEAMND
jgi:hypothetical protein